MPPIGHLFPHLGIDKYTKKYGVDDSVVSLPYEVVIDALEEFE